MASIYRRGEWWYLKYYVPGVADRPVRLALHTTSRKIAEQKLKLVEADLVRQRLGIPSRIPIDPLLDEYFTDMRARRRHRSAETAIGRLKKLFGALGVGLLEDVTPDMVRSYLNNRIIDGEITQKTANEYRVCLHTLFEFALANKGYVSRDPQFPNPMKRVKRYKTRPDNIRYLELPQIRAQIEALEPWPELRAMVLLYIYAGLRREEGLWPTPKDVLLSNRPPIIHVRKKTVEGQEWEPKNGKDRIVPVSSSHCLFSRSPVDHDGLIAAYGRIYVATRNGEVVRARWNPPRETVDPVIQDTPRPVPVDR